MKSYKIKLALEWDEASQSYSVTSPDVPQLFTFGSTLAEIQANVQEAIEVLLDGLKELDKEPPAALRQPISGSIIEMPILADGMPLAA